MMSRFWVSLVLSAGLAVCGRAAAGPHPLHDDGGAVNWRPTLRAALDAAQRAGKPVFIDLGREG